MSANTPPLARLERHSRRVLSLNRLLLCVVPVVLLAGTLDLAQWAQRWRKPLDPLTPSLEDLRKPLPDIAELSLPAALFEAPEPVKAGKAPETAVAVEEVRWKLKAVFMGETSRAYLEKEDGSGGAWISEGEKVADLRIKQIQERSVTVESPEGTYELRL